MYKQNKHMLNNNKNPWLRTVPRTPAILLFIILFSVVFPGLFTDYSTTLADLPNRLLPPGTEGHIFGTDTLGRDLFTRVLYGGRVSLLVAALVLVVSGSIGLTVAIVAGYLGGKVDALLMRIVDIFLSFPPMLIAIVFAVAFEPGVLTVVTAISISYWSKFCRVIRADVLQIKEQEYIALAKVAGCSDLYIMVRHILPNVLDTFLVVMSLEIGMVIRLEATLSFLGAGIAPPTPSWGQMVGAGRDYLMNAWWLSILPGGALAALIFCFNMIGDWIRDMMDPHLRAVLSVKTEKKRWLKGISTSRETITPANTK